MNNKNIIVVRNLIRCLELESLRNKEVVSNLIRAFGIVQWGTTTFGKDEIFKNRNEDMAGIYQTPAQLAEALIYLSQFKINSYAEIGVFQGGTFIFVSEYLKRFNTDIQCIGIDPTDYLNPEIKAIIDSEIWLNFKKTTSESFKGKSFDLVFIDGNHEGGWTKKDWENLGQYSLICMFHDVQGPVCPEVVSFWENLKKGTKKNTIEFLESTSDMPFQGIGIIHNQKEK